MSDNACLRNEPIVKPTILPINERNVPCFAKLSIKFEFIF